MRGRTLVEVTGWRDAIVLAHLPAAGESRFLLDVDLESRLSTGDRVVVCGDPRSVANLLAGSDEGGGAGLRWASKLRRYGRVVWRTLTAIDRPVNALFNNAGVNSSVGFASP